MKNTDKKTGKLLELFTQSRTREVLDRTVLNDKDYCSTLKQQDEAFNILHKAGLDKEQCIIVDRVVSATNACSAAYGKVAYRLGFHDGVRIVEELREMNKSPF